MTPMGKLPRYRLALKPSLGKTPWLVKRIDAEMKEPIFGLPIELESVELPGSYATPEEALAEADRLNAQESQGQQEP
jgi:hypothetical protein